MTGQSRSADSKLPPPLPSTSAGSAAPLSYASAAQPATAAGGESGAQRVFDTVAGPNLRLADNLIQLGCVVVGAVLGGGVGWVLSLNKPNSSSSYVIGGVLAGLVGSLVISGFVIGIIRGKNAVKKR